MVKNLRYLRNKSGLSQQELAEQIESVQQTIHAYEVGTREPDIEMLMNLASFFHTSIDFLVGYSTGTSNELMLTEQECNIVRQIEKLPQKAIDALETFLMLHED